MQVLCSGCPGVEAARSPVCVAAPQLPRTMAGVTAPFHKQLMGTKLKYRYVRCPTVPRMWQVLNKQRPGGADEPAAEYRQRKSRLEQSKPHPLEGEGHSREEEVEQKALSLGRCPVPVSSLVTVSQTNPLTLH